MDVGILSIALVVRPNWAFIRAQKLAELGVRGFGAEHWQHDSGGNMESHLLCAPYALLRRRTNQKKEQNG